VVESVVNRVGVNINTASHMLLKHVSGINSSLAKKIVKYRDDNGTITSRDQLKGVSGMGDKSYEQCAGFLKIPESPNALDNTWVHPENYGLASEILEGVRAGTDPTKEQRAALKEKYGVGDTTVDDIVAELKKPNRDPRDDYPKPVLQQGVLAFDDLKEGMKVTGKVKNVVDFGAFIDIGIKESALIHVSELSDQFVKDPMDVLKVGDVKEFRIISLDIARKRIGLSLKSERRPDAPGAARPESRPASPKPADQSPGNPSNRPDGTRRVLVARRSDAPAPAGNQNSPAGSQGAPQPGSSARSPGYGGSRSGQGAGARPGATNPPERDDDGMSYNPFADLLKNRKK